MMYLGYDRFVLSSVLNDIKSRSLASSFCSDPKETDITDICPDSKSLNFTNGNNALMFHTIWPKFGGGGSVIRPHEKG